MTRYAPNIVEALNSAGLANKATDFEKFVWNMLSRLTKSEHEKGWGAKDVSGGRLVRRLKDNLSDYERGASVDVASLIDGDVQPSALYARMEKDLADVANYAMMLFSRLENYTQ